MLYLLDFVFRLFLLLTSMSQLSLRQYSVITSALSLLEKLLFPLLAEDNQATSPHSFDFSLLEWVTLYVSNMLDVMETSYDVPPKAKGLCFLFSFSNTFSTSIQALKSFM